jgi:hypothetical protein
MLPSGGLGKTRLTTGSCCSSSAVAPAIFCQFLDFWRLSSATAGRDLKCGGRLQLDFRLLPPRRHSHNPTGYSLPVLRLMHEGACEQVALRDYLMTGYEHIVSGIWTMNNEINSGSNAFFEHPILNSPYVRPPRHWELDEAGVVNRARRLTRAVTYDNVQGGQRFRAHSHAMP